MQFQMTDDDIRKEEQARVSERNERSLFVRGFSKEMTEEEVKQFAPDADSIRKNGFHTFFVFRVSLLFGCWLTG